MDLALVDALARLRLEARRAGLDLVVREVPEELGLLISFCGLDVVLAVECQRQTEEREERLGVEEEAELDDAAV
jgi:hypothetical protein